MVVSAVAQPPDFVQLASQLKPAVVNISTAKSVKPNTPTFRGPQGPGQDLFEDFFERFFRDRQQQPRKARSLGSGFIISEDGYILTNDHVVDGADEITVKLSDGREFTGEVKGLDAKLDLALVKIDAGEELPVAHMGDSEDLKVGEWVMAIGNPFGLEQTVTVGIVSAKGRVIGAGPYDDFIQTDASINPGNSGGPLFNVQGEVVGINTAIVAGGQGIGFAIPVNMAKQVVAQLRDDGHVTRGWLGVMVQPMTKELAKSFDLDKARGALVSDVVKDSPADQAGLKRGDVILVFDGQEIDDINDLPRAVAATPVDKEVSVVYFRDGEEQRARVMVGTLKEEGGTVVAKEAGTMKTLGIKVAELTPQLVERYGITGAQGVLVSQIVPDGPAVEANLKVGDLLVEIDGQQVTTVAAVEKLVADFPEGKVLRLLVQRREALFYTTVTIK
jgi:serine protease Do